MAFVLRRRVMLGTGVLDELVPHDIVADDRGVVRDRHVSRNRLAIDAWPSSALPVRRSVLDVMLR